MAEPATSLPAHLIPTAGTADDRVAVVVADGEHYPAAVQATIDALRAAGWTIAGVALIGGAEKLRSEPDFGVPHVRGATPVAALDACLASHPTASTVIDLSDEPALVFEARMLLVGACAAAGRTYLGADLVVPQIPQQSRIGAPTLAVIGTGKRIGKTAVSAHVARLADDVLGGHKSVIVVAMGRGGPEAPVLVDRADGAMSVDRLLAISRAGSHAASDYLEDAALTGLTTVGCRRVGGGILGVPVQSNVRQGAELAASLDPPLVLLEGSGACIPPVHADGTILLASVARPRDLASDLGSFRSRRADLVLVVGEDAEAARSLADAAGEHAVAVRLEPTPVTPIDGRTAAVFTTAAAEAAPVFAAAMERAGATPAFVSTALARRDELARDVEDARAAGADTFVVEIKAAGIDVVAEAADRHGLDLVFLDNRPVAHDPGFDLDAKLAEVVRSAVAAHAHS